MGLLSVYATRRDSSLQSGAPGVAPWKVKAPASSKLRRLSSGRRLLEHGQAWGGDGSSSAGFKAPRGGGQTTVASTQCHSSGCRLGTGNRVQPSCLQDSDTRGAAPQILGCTYRSCARATPAMMVTQAAVKCNMQHAPTKRPQFATHSYHCQSTLMGSSLPVLKHSW